MEAIIFFVMFSFLLTALLMSCRWYILRLTAYNELLARQERRRRAVAHANGQEIMIFTVERGIHDPPTYEADREMQRNNIPKEEPPSYEDALKLPSYVVEGPNIQQPTVVNETERGVTIESVAAAETNSTTEPSRENHI